jgi:uncharacterized protein
MQTNILWKGREYESLENCLVTISNEGSDIRSTIVGHYESTIYQVNYLIKTNALWETISVEIQARHSGQTQTIKFESDGKGRWKDNGKSLPQFDGCIEIDIPLTPFTNTLPINRLKLDVNQTELIRVIYMDLLAGEIKPVHQKYTRVSPFAYHYENVPNDFEANILVDELGLVVDYPTLFERLAESKTSFG